MASCCNPRLTPSSAPGIKLKPGTGGRPCPASRPPLHSCPLARSPASRSWGHTSPPLCFAWVLGLGCLLHVGLPGKAHTRLLLSDSRRGAVAVSVAPTVRSEFEFWFSLQLAMWSWPSYFIAPKRNLSKRKADKGSPKLVCRIERTSCCPGLGAG